MMSKNNNIKIGDRFIILNVTAAVWEVTVFLDYQGLPPHARLREVEDTGTLVIALAALTDKTLFRRTTSPEVVPGPQENENFAQISFLQTPQKSSIKTDGRARIETLFGNSSKMAASL